MTALVICATLFLIFLVLVLGGSFFPAPFRMFIATPVRIVAWFVLSSLLGFTLVNDILKIENPIELTVMCMLMVATLASIIRRQLIPESSILKDMVPALVGVLLFAATRFVMHAVGMNVVDQFEVFLD